MFYDITKQTHNSTPDIYSFSFRSYDYALGQLQAIFRGLHQTFDLFRTVLYRKA